MRLSWIAAYVMLNERRFLTKLVIIVRNSIHSESTLRVLFFDIVLIVAAGTALNRK